ncbi:MAG: ATP-dependent DNA helicase RecG [Candidatus Adiutrix sp.]|jgi:ATP-dependent DNA helicase RecG|nr:ATP-dependent DNA helicase RecG [Candidatus Adiutrix sp.]
MLIWPDHPAFSSPLSQLKGVGPKILARLNEAGFFLSGDLLGLSPRFYQDRRQALPVSRLRPEAEALVEAVVVAAARARWSPRSRRRYAECQVEDEEGGRLFLCWFNFPGHLLKSLSRGRQLRLFGRVRLSARGWEMAHPDLEFLPEDGGPEAARPAGGRSAGLRPVYPPLGRLSSGQVKKFLDQILPLLADCPALCPADWLARNGLNDPVKSLGTLHSPPGDFSGPPPRPAQSRAYRQLALFELVFWRLMMLRGRAGPAAGGRRPDLEKGRRAMRDFWRLMPFEASAEQRRVSRELAADLSAERPMSRLLQGEVGGGKTAVAASALFFALGRGGQGALMAPTEVLARQHYDFLKGPAEKLGFETVLLTGALSAGEKQAAREALAEGRASLAVGSQAILSPATVFKNLSLAVIDEQHRFGVKQRLTLRRKNRRVDLLAMSATPIPRSLTLMLYGDLEASVLNGLLPGRRPAETTLFEPDQRLAAYRRFLDLVGPGGQGFLVTPRIEARPEDRDEDRDEPSSPSLAGIYRDLKKIAGPGFSLAALHGRMSPGEQEAALEDFRLGRLNILVATSIIEVGVDVPAARVILIEGAERFGLAQLHQLRGRVGRGGQDGHCLLLPSKITPAGGLRLRTLVREHNGQALAEMDLSLRGPGEQLGLRQSGWPSLAYASLPRDLPLLPRAHRLAEEIWAARGADDRWQNLWGRLDFEALSEVPIPDGGLD